MAQPKWSITKNTESMILNVEKEQKLSYVKRGLTERYFNSYKVHESKLQYWLTFPCNIQDLNDINHCVAIRGAVYYKL